MAQKSASTIRGPTVMSYRNLETENTVPVGSLLCAERSVVVVGAATGTGQAVAAAFAAAGVRRLAFVDSDDTSATQDLALKAAAANKLTPPDLLTLHLQRENSVSLEEKVEEVRRKWGHVDIIINHADHMCLSVAYTALKKQAVTDQQAKCFECGSNNAYDIIHAFIPLLLAGPEKTLINILPPSSPVLKLGAGAEMIAEMANGQMADCLMVDHGHEGLLAYSIHLSGSPEKGRSYPANQGLFTCYGDFQYPKHILTFDS
jgi:NAD(P)-dependent dehydrogenase (short-subunit alcohol dehydrogenase family)